MLPELAEVDEKDAPHRSETARKGSATTRGLNFQGGGKSILRRGKNHLSCYNNDSHITRPICFWRNNEEVFCSRTYRHVCLASGLGATAPHDTDEDARNAGKTRAHDRRAAAANPRARAVSCVCCHAG
jgi:hypothetical protein